MPKRKAVQMIPTMATLMTSMGDVYEKRLAQARAEGDHELVRLLEALGEPRITEPEEDTLQGLQALQEIGRIQQERDCKFYEATRIWYEGLPENSPWRERKGGQKGVYDLLRKRVERLR